jgi:hypothetical protein
MRLPQLTADCGIGPALGTYMRAAMPGSALPGSATPSPAARWSLVPQMMADLNDLADAGMEAWIDLHQGELYTTACPGKTCWGKKGSARVYTCCDATTEKCAYNGNTPICAPTKGSN